MLQTVNKVKRQINPKLRIEGILLTTVDSRTNYVLCLFYHVPGRPQVVLGTSFAAGDKDLREIRTSWEQMKIIRLWKMICGGRWIILNSPIRNMTSTVTLWMKSGTTLMSLRHI